VRSAAAISVAADRLLLLDETLHEGARLRGTLYLGANTVEFDFYWWPWEVYEEACRTVGFRSCKIEPFLIPAESEHERGEGFWDEYIAAPSGMRLDFHGLESDLGQQAPVLRLLKSAGDTADPQLHAPLHGLGHLAAEDDVGDCEATAGFEHTEGLRQHLPLVRLPRQRRVALDGDHTFTALAPLARLLRSWGSPPSTSNG
jgi:hypothetical protein